MSTKRLHSPYAIYSFVLPALIVYTVILAFPVFRSVRMSFFAWDGLSTPVFSGLENFRALVGDPDFYLSLKNGLIFALVLVVYQIGIASILSFILATGRIRAARLFRDSFFVPVVLSVTVVCQLWLSMYNPEYGLINTAADRLDLSFEQNWLVRPPTAIWAVAMVNAWQFMGYHLVLLFTAVKAIPETYFEAATMEGAGGVRKAVSITIPLLSETYRFCLIIALTGGLRAFEHIAIMTGGGPGTSTYTLTYYMYRAAFRLNDFGLASASVTILVAECLLFTWLINRFLERRTVEY
jgi:raffinose/stachyose/melibiose transport system permease protein